MLRTEGPVSSEKSSVGIFDGQSGSVAIFFLRVLIFFPGNVLFSNAPDNTYHEGLLKIVFGHNAKDSSSILRALHHGRIASTPALYSGR